MTFLDAGDRRADLPGRAVAALKSVVLEERSLDRVQLVAVRQALDRGDLVAFVDEGETQAGIESPAIHQHGAGAALAVVATFLRACQLQMFAKSVEQRRARIDLQGVLLAVDLELDLHCRNRCGGWRVFRRFDRSHSHQGRSKTNGNAGSGYLFEETAARFRAAEDRKIVQAASWIDRDQLSRIDRLGIVVVHHF